MTEGLEQGRAVKEDGFCFFVTDFILTLTDHEQGVAAVKVTASTAGPALAWCSAGLSGMAAKMGEASGASFTEWEALAAAMTTEESGKRLRTRLAANGFEADRVSLSWSTDDAEAPSEKMLLIKADVVLDKNTSVMSKRCDGFFTEDGVMLLEWALSFAPGASPATIGRDGTGSEEPVVEQFLHPYGSLRPGWGPRAAVAAERELLRMSTGDCRGEGRKPRI